MSMKLGANVQWSTYRKVVVGIGTRTGCSYKLPGQRWFGRTRGGQIKIGGAAGNACSGDTLGAR
jgi:hypothetical protein